MEQRQAEGPKTQTRQSCVTKQDLDKAAWFEDKKSDEQSTRTVVTSTPRTLDSKLECARGGSMQSGMLTVEALDSTNVKGDVHMLVSGGVNTMTMNSHFTSMWLGPTCGTVK